MDVTNFWIFCKYKKKIYILLYRLKLINFTENVGGGGGIIDYHSFHNNMFNFFYVSAQKLFKCYWIESKIQQPATAKWQ